MKYLVTLLLFLGVTVRLQAGDLTSADFASGYSLEVDNGGAIYALELPVDVYHSVRRADLGDVRIFNGAGEVVPHALRPLANPAEEMRQQASVPFFPLSESRAIPPSDLAMRVTRNSDGTIVNIEAGSQDSGALQVSGYLLDLSGLKWPVGELALLWQDSRDSSIFAIALQHSNDLQHWTPLVARSTLVSLRHSGQQIDKRTVVLPGNVQKYIKLSWQDSGEPLRLTKITGFSPVIESLQRRHWADLQAGSVLDERGELTIEYHTSSRLAAGSGQFAFPQSNSIARLTLQSRDDDKADWRTRCDQPFYTLSVADTVVRSEPCTFPATSDRLWRAVVREDGAGIRAGRQLPSLQLGWRPCEILFVGRGDPPFVLAFGSGKLEHEENRADGQMIVQAAAGAASGQAIGTARLGRRIVLGGEKALQAPPLPPPWKKWLLWLILVGGVAVLAAMARSLITEMNKG